MSKFSCLDLPGALSALPGRASIYLENLSTGETTFVNSQDSFIAASVIKLSVMLEAFRRFENGTLDPNGLTRVSAEVKVPSCGALTYMHDGLEITWLDAVTLMIILSDNTATNIMIDKLGIEEINRTLDSYNLTGMRLRRKMFDAEASARGLQNTITAQAVGVFLRMLYQGELVSKDASDKMLKILLNQRLNGKMPFHLYSRGVKIAHKTGEDSGTSHDAGIIFLDEPIIAVFLSNETDVPAFERLIQDTCLQLM